MSQNPIPPERSSDHAQAAEWFVRLRAEDCDAAERQAFERWLATDDRRRLAYADVAAAAWALEQQPADVGETRSPPPRRRDAWRPSARFALAAMFGLALLWLAPTRYWWTSFNADWVSQRAEVRQLLLEDGSQVWLGADSALSQRFDGGRRVLELHRGTVFAEVMPDAGRPFIVEAGGLSAQALGTRYSVSRYSDALIEVEVEEGRVAVASGDQRRELLAGDALDCQPAACRARTLGPTEVAEWRNGMLRFEDVPLSEVIATLRAHLDKPVIVLSDPVLSTPVTALIPSQQSEAALRSLCARHGLRLEAWGTWLVVRA